MAEIWNRQFPERNLEEDMCAMLLTHPLKPGVSEKNRMKEKKVSGFLHSQYIELAYHAGRGALLTKEAEGWLLAEDSPLETMHCWTADLNCFR